jgi:HPt (histidine-containing phosphotransfer) domain-containing protein
MSLHNLLAELQKEYLESLPEKIAAINGLIKSGEMELVETEFHKLKGTGRTYGVPEISRVGELGERACWIPDSKRDAAIAQALELLQKVHQSRAQGKDCLIEDDDTCKSLAKLIESYKFE